MRQKFPLYSSLFTAFAVASGLLALTLTDHHSVRWFFSLATLLLSGISAGRALWPRHQPSWQLLWGTISHLASIIVVGTATYYLYQYNLTATYIITLALPIIWLIYGLLKNSNSLTPTPHSPLPTSTTINHPSFPSFHSLPSFLLSIAAITLFALAIHTWFNSSTNLAIRSPWEIAPRGALIFIGLGVLATLAAARRRFSLSHSPTLPLLSLTIGIIATTTVALGVYRTGYGFDPFLHRAAETIVIEQGAVTPKTPYYIGQYVLIATLHRFTGLEVNQLDPWLLPLLAAALVPITYSVLKRRNFDDYSATIGTSTTLLIPLSGFIVTTPQGLANLFATIAILSAVAHSSTSHFPTFLIALAAVCIHPLAGIPVFIGLIASYFFSKNFRVFGWLCAVVAAFSVPLMFALNSIASNNVIHLTTPANLQILTDQFFGHLPYRRFNFWYDLAYWWKTAGILIFLGISALVWLKRKNTNFSQLQTPLIIAAILIINAIILKGFINFPFLVAGEQLVYGTRLLELAALTLIPVVAIWLSSISSLQPPTDTPPNRNSHPNTIPLIITIAAIVAANTYATYPHLDTYESSRGFSTSIADLQAVQAIDQDGNNSSYLVLANQSVAAVAIQEFGFKKYFPTASGQLFYYPVPTTSPLSTIFVDLMANPSNARQLINQARQTSGLNTPGNQTVYVIVDDYWWNAALINRTLTNLADQNWDFHDGAARVYKFSK